MKHCLLLIFFVISVSLYSQRYEKSNDMCGTYMLYPLPVKRQTPAPEGYKPLFLNHIGRHGSRFPVSDADLNTVETILMMQKQADNLSDSGDDLLLKIKDFYLKCYGKWGQLSSVGAEQQQGIGERLVSQYGSNLFVNIRSWVDPQKRCADSYVHFLNGIRQVVPVQLIINRTDMERENDLLNFFLTDKLYQNFKKEGIWISNYEKYKKDILSQIHFIDRYFKSSESVSEKVANELSMALYNIWAIAPDIPVFEDSRPLLDDKDQMLLWKIQNVRQYLEKGPSPIADMVQVYAARPLLKNFIETSDQNLLKTSYGAFLRFSHAEAIIPFAALLRIPQASVSTTITEDISLVWHDYVVSPMAANIIWVFYKNSNGHILVKMLLNEQEVAFPLPAWSFPYYEWEKVRSYYIRNYNLDNKLKR